MKSENDFESMYSNLSEVKKREIIMRIFEADIPEKTLNEIFSGPHKPKDQKLVCKLCGRPLPL